jgi:cell division protein FtsB
MTITIEEVERLIEWWPSGATALRSLAVERDALKAEIEKLRAEAVRVAVSCGELMTRNEKLRAELKTARRDALEEAARRILIYFNNNHIAQNTAAAIRALGEIEEEK